MFSLCNSKRHTPPPPPPRLSNPLLMSQHIEFDDNGQLTTDPDSGMPLCYSLETKETKDKQIPKGIENFYKDKIAIRLAIRNIENIDINSNPPSFTCQFTLHLFFRINLLEAPGSDKGMFSIL